MNSKEVENDITVSDLIEFLQTNFKPDTKLCWIDCIEGFKYDCKPFYKNKLGKHNFVYVKQDKERLLKDKTNIDDYYQFVNDNDILIN